MKAYLRLGAAGFLLSITPGCVIVKDSLVVHAPLTVNPSAGLPKGLKGESGPEEDERDTAVVDKAMVTLAKEIKPAVDHTPPAPAVAAPEPAASAVVGVRCTEFKPPVFAPLPQLSAEEYGRIDRKNKDALINALTRHIEELYSNARDYRERVAKAQAQHHKTCKK